MTQQQFFQKEWPKIKRELLRVSQEAMTLAKKGEVQLRHISHQGKLQFDVAALALKKEHLFFQIGQEFIKSEYPGPHSPQIRRLLNEFHKIEKQQQVIRRKIRAKGSPKRQDRS